MHYGNSLQQQQQQIQKIQDHSSIKNIMAEKVPDKATKPDNLSSTVRMLRTWWMDNMDF